MGVLHLRARRSHHHANKQARQTRTPRRAGARENPCVKYVSVNVVNVLKLLWWHQLMRGIGLGYIDSTNPLKGECLIDADSVSQYSQFLHIPLSAVTATCWRTTIPCHG